MTLFAASQLHANQINQYHVTQLICYIQTCMFAAHRDHFHLVILEVRLKIQPLHYSYILVVSKLHNYTALKHIHASQFLLLQRLKLYT